MLNIGLVLCTWACMYVNIIPRELPKTTFQSSQHYCGVSSCLSRARGERWHLSSQALTRTVGKSFKAQQPWTRFSPEAKGFLVSVITGKNEKLWSVFEGKKVLSLNHLSRHIFWVFCCSNAELSFLLLSCLWLLFPWIIRCELPGTFLLLCRTTFCNSRNSCVCLMSPYLDASTRVTAPCSLYMCGRNAEYSPCFSPPFRAKHQIQ